MARARLSIKVFGKVQGVNFRYSTCEKARALDLHGFVKNCNDGTVEIIAEGSEEKLNSLLRWAQEGPSFASVETVEHEWRECEGGVGEFSVSF